MENIDIDLQSILKLQFESGEGVLHIGPHMSDELIALAIRNAIRDSNGRTFKVIGVHDNANS